MKKIKLHEAGGARTFLMTTAALSLALTVATPSNAIACDETSQDLYAGQSEKIGIVKVCYGGGSANDWVEFDTTGGDWRMTEAHLAIEADSNDIPTRKGNAVPGKFEFQENFDPSMQKYRFEGLTIAGTDYVSAHAKVENTNTDAVESAWVIDDHVKQFPGNDWSTYFQANSGGTQFLCGTGGTSKCVFVTANTYQGDLGGIDGAGKICQEEADDSDIVPNGTYKAWLASTNGDDPESRFTQSTVPYKLVNGDKVADDWADLTDGSLDHAIDRDQYDYGILGDKEVWTNVKPDGKNLNLAACNPPAWDSNDASKRGYYGLLDKTDGNWTQHDAQGCNRRAHLYCFQQ